MHIRLLEILRCPKSRQQLYLDRPQYRSGRVESGYLTSEDGKEVYPIRDFIPRFVTSSNYADSFGLQWNTFRRTQLDSCSGHTISAQRFWKSTGWLPASIETNWVLDVGCGAGRFAEIALAAGANLVALDYSGAVDACHANLRRYENLHIVQADIYALPFVEGAFSHVYSLGVLQHTPDVKKAFMALPAMLAPGGRLCVDFYERSWKRALLPKYWLRPMTKRVPKQQLFDFLQVWVPRLFHLSCSAARVPLLGPSLRRLIPVANHVGVLPLDEAQQLEWSLLDTFDWFAPEYDKPQSAHTVEAWFREANLAFIEVLKAGHLVARGMAPHAARH